jgi:pimeloyl-ACP methyl ester carboxylesterase
MTTLMLHPVSWLALAGALLINVVAYRHARVMLRFSGPSAKSKNPEDLGRFDKLAILLTGISNPRPADTESPAAHGLSFERHIIFVGENVTLGAWFVPHGSPVGSVLFFHGYAASKSTLLPEAAAFHSRGYSALLVDFRGSADSSEAYTTVGYREADDVIAAVRYAETQLGLRSPVIYGRSMGAAAVLRAIALTPLSARGLILEGVFDQMLTTVKQRFHAMGLPATPFAHLLVLWGGLQFGFWAFTHNPSAYARRCSLPVLMLHGTDDPRATLAHARVVLEALAGDKDLCQFEGAKHEALAITDGVRWEEAVDRFLQAVAGVA